MSNKDFTLYELADEIVVFLQEIEEMDGIEDAFDDTLESVSAQFNDKVINTAKYIKNLETTLYGIEQAIKSMSERKKKLESKKSWLKSYLLKNMIRTGTEKVERDEITVKVAKIANPAVVIENESMFMDKYPEMVLIVPETRKPDKNSIKDLLKKGANLEHASLSKKDKYIAIK